MSITKEELVEQLLLIHRKYSDERESTLESPMATMWSTSDPPDLISYTPPLEEIEDFVQCFFEEEDAILFYDMNIRDAADFIWDYINEMD